MNATQQITIEKVQSTETFKKLNDIQKKITASRNNVRQIQDGLNIAKNIGFDAWSKSNKYYHVNKSIIQELLKK